MKKLYVVDTIVMYRMKYVIEADELEHAFDEVTMRDSGAESDYFDEVTQRCLGEHISDGREITMDEFTALLDTLAADKDEQSNHWLKEKVIRKINYKNDPEN